MFPNGSGTGRTQSRGSGAPQGSTLVQERCARSPSTATLVWRVVHKVVQRMAKALGQPKREAKQAGGGTDKPTYLPWSPIYIYI